MIAGEGTQVIRRSPQAIIAFTTPGQLADPLLRAPPVS